MKLVKHRATSAIVILFREITKETLIAFFETQTFTKLPPIKLIYKCLALYENYYKTVMVKIDIWERYIRKDINNYSVPFCTNALLLVYNASTTPEKLKNFLRQTCIKLRSNFGGFIKFDI